MSNTSATPTTPAAPPTDCSQNSSSASDSALNAANAITDSITKETRIYAFGPEIIKAQDILSKGEKKLLVQPVLLMNKVQADAFREETLKYKKLRIFVTGADRFPAKGKYVAILEKNSDTLALKDVADFTDLSVDEIVEELVGAHGELMPKNDKEAFVFIHIDAKDRKTALAAFEQAAQKLGNMFAYELPREPKDAKDACQTTICLLSAGTLRK